MPAAGVALAAGVAANVRKRWPGAVVDSWCRSVAGEFAELSCKYGVAETNVLTARFALVVAASTDLGRVVMRSSPDPAGGTQAAVIRELARLDIGPTVHDVVTTDTGTWTITEEVVPGTPLSDVDHSAIRPDAVLRIFRRLASQPAPVVGMESIEGWLRDRLVSPSTADLPAGQRNAPEHERQRAVGVLDDLTGSGEARQLCHGDGYPGNVLTSEDGRLVWIDPRGLSGEVGYDIAVFALKASGHIVSQASLMAEYIAGQVGVDSRRAQSWVTVASAARV